MSGFSVSTRGRAWVVTIQVQNMKNAGLSKEEYEDPEKLADFFTKLWNESGDNRTSGIAVCKSEDGLYHAHMACYGNTTTLKRVSDTLFQSHVEPQKGGKSELSAYLQKEGSYAEKGEQVLYCIGIENVQDVQGRRTDFEMIQELLDDGESPQQILQRNFAFRRYENMIRTAFLEKRITEAPIEKQMNVEYHFGKSGSGKSYTYYELCKKHGRENVYLANDLRNGGFDFYLDRGAPPILFIDDLKPTDLTYKEILNLTDKYSDLQTHCRFKNTYNLWNTVIITSVFPPDKLYQNMVEKCDRDIDSFKQLQRRFSYVFYHYVEDGEFKVVSLPAKDYKDEHDFLTRTVGDKNGYVDTKHISEGLPFE